MGVLVLEVVIKFVLIKRIDKYTYLAGTLIRTFGQLPTWTVISIVMMSNPIDGS